VSIRQLADRTKPPHSPIVSNAYWIRSDIERKIIVSKAAFLAVAMRKSNLEPSKFFLTLSQKTYSSLVHEKNGAGPFG